MRTLIRVVGAVHLLLGSAVAIGAAPGGAMVSFLFLAAMAWMYVHPAVVREFR